MIQKLVLDIKAKKELHSLSDIFVESLLKQYLAKNKIKNLPQPGTKNYKIIIKEVRSILREVYSAFKEKRFEKRKKILEELKGFDDLETHKKILLLHMSTRERIEDYPSIYQKIFEITGKPKKILDLGAGLNPFSLPYMHLSEVEYVAVELTEEDCEFIQQYFNRLKIKGTTLALDLTKVEELPETEVCFLFKILDSLETLKRDVTKELLQKIKAKYIVISFPKHSLSGKSGMPPRRLKWFEEILKNFEHKTFETRNEKFFVITL